MRNIKNYIKWFFKIAVYLNMGLVFTACKKNQAANAQTGTSTIDTLQKVYYKWDKFVMGADLSYTNQVQDYGGVYKENNIETDPYVILKNHGCNVVRVRLWNNPAWQKQLNDNGKIYCDLADAEKQIRRAKNAGMAVNLNVHYSDNWAGPGQQAAPAAWTGNGQTLKTIKDSVYNYTMFVLNYLKERDLVPEMIAVGNETNDGILFPYGSIINDDWTAFGLLLNSGIKAVRDFSSTSVIKPQIILHIGTLTGADWWMGNITTKGLVTDFDILGISFYPKWSSLSTMDQVGAMLKAVRVKYNKKVMVMETSYPWTTSDADNYANIIAPSFAGYDGSKDGQYKFMKDLTQQIISAGGSGILYWEPSWITSKLKDQWGTGSSWDNCTFFDFSGNLIKGIDFMNYPYSF